MHHRRMGLLIGILGTLIAVTGLSRRAAAAPDIAASPVVAATPMDQGQNVPAENPLHAADDATRQQALGEAWNFFQRACRPCHGNLGAGDGPYAATFARRAADLRRPSRAIVGDAVRFTRIRDGAAALAERSWESSMPAFGDDLDARHIWGLVLLLEDFGKEGTGLDPNATGGDTYASRCAVCHGANGGGDGPLAAELMPPPRDLRRGAYRFRSTEYGAAPLDTDIIGVVARGLGTTAMGRFLHLGVDRLENLAAHLETLAPAVFASDPPALPGHPMPAEAAAQLATRGRTIYEETRCWECHGKTGRGDGPSAATLKDDTGRLSTATNFTKRWQAKAGGGAPDIFRVISGGMNGTPMPSYAGTLSPDDRWAVAYYIERLGRAARFSPTVQAGIVTEQLPSDPTASFWRTIPATAVFLGPQVEIPPYWTEPSVDAVDVTVAVNGDQIGILLVWDDRTRDVRNDDAGSIPTIAAAVARYGTWRLPDRIAVQFPVKVDPKGALPPFYLGDTDQPVERWIWSADRYERGEQQAIVDRVAGARATPVTRTDGPPVQTAATFVDGQWRVVLLGKRPPKTAATTTIALQSWDGATGESGPWHSLSSWITVNLR